MSKRIESPKGVGKRISWLLAELLVVFIGVYAAFSLAQFQEAKQEREQRVQLLESILEDLNYLAEAGRAQVNIDQIDQYIDAIENQQAPLYWSPSKIPYRPDVWEAALQSDGIRLIELPLLMRLSRFYGGLKDMIDNMYKRDEYLKDVLLPNIDKDKTEFYNSNGKLKAKYMWYLHSLKETRSTVKALLSEADKLILIIDEEVD